jgi:hypothetical protein
VIRQHFREQRPNYGGRSGLPKTFSSVMRLPMGTLGKLRHAQILGDARNTAVPGGMRTLDPGSQETLHPSEAWPSGRDALDRPEQAVSIGVRSAEIGQRVFNEAFGFRAAAKSRGHSINRSGKHL